MHLSDRLATFIASAPDLSPDALEQAKRALLDTLGVALAGASEPAARIIATSVLELRGAPEAAVIGGSAGPDGAPAPEAALANGVAAHALDFDDVSLPMRGHPSAPLLPAALAVAEANGRSGRELLTAYVLGFEVQARLGRIAGEAHYALGWHATSTLGTLGAASACSRLLGLDAGRTGAALGIAASLASGLQANFGSMAKPLHAGWAARSGVVAAGLAARGFTSGPDALQGFLRAMTGGASLDMDAMGAPGEPYEITSSGIGVKLYPCCYATHRALDAVLELRQRYRIDVGDIREVRVAVNRGGLMPLRAEPPSTGLEGKFSLEYCLAAALTDGRVSLATFSDEAVRRPQVRRLMSTVRASEGEQAADYPIGGYAEVRIALAGGAEHRLKVETPRGDPTRPLSWDELAAKFHDCASTLLSTDVAEQAMRTIRQVDDLPDVGMLTEALAAQTDQVG